MPCITTSPLHPWEWSDRPWVYQLCWIILGKQFLVVVDAHIYKWPEVQIVNSATTATTIEHLPGVDLGFSEGGS